MSDRPHVRVDPATRFGRPSIGGVTVEIVGLATLTEGVAAVIEEFPLTRGQVLTACWFLGSAGSKRWRVWRGWAETVHPALAAAVPDYDAIPDPPEMPDRPADPTEENPMENDLTSAQPTRGEGGS